jgi:hypothetical protein
MSHMGQSATSRFVRAESALASNRTLASLTVMSQLYEQTHAPQQRTYLFDHLVGDHEQRVRNGNAKRAGGRQVDDQFESGRLRDRQIGRLLTFEDSAGVDAGLPVRD